eukprot:SM000049S16706  [mRNA]  locus=s49:268841:271781:+ [translate_table: standard]
MEAGSWKYRGGLVLIACVVLIWVASAEVTQEIYTKYDHPFIITWLGASLLAIYLPVNLLKNLLKALLQPKGTLTAKGSVPDFTVSLPPRKDISLVEKSPRKSNGFELQGGPANFNDEEEAHGLLSRTFDGIEAPRNVEALTKWQVFKISAVLAPLWLVTEYLSNSSLSLTSVASTTILSSTSGLFTLLFGAILGTETLTLSKILATIITIAGVVMTEVGKTNKLILDRAAAGAAIATSTPEHSLLGDTLGLLSAVSYGVFTVFLKRFVGSEEAVDMQQVFGFMGCISMVCLGWLVIPLIGLGWEPPLALPRSHALDEDILANGLVGSVLSDYFWALSVVWTTPLVATLGLSLTIPLAMTADIILHGASYSYVYILGSAQVFAGFLIANLSDQCSMKRQTKPAVR